MSLLLLRWSFHLLHLLWYVGVCAPWGQMNKKRGVASSGQTVVMKNKGCGDFLSAVPGQGTKSQVKHCQVEQWYNRNHSEFTHLLLLDTLMCRIFWTINSQETHSTVMCCVCNCQPEMQAVRARFKVKSGNWYWYLFWIFEIGSWNLLEFLCFLT